MRQGRLYDGIRLPKCKFNDGMVTLFYMDEDENEFRKHRGLGHSLMLFTST